MPLVRTYDQIMLNLQSLEVGRAVPENGQYYQDLIRRGRVFFPCLSDEEELCFAPSRFLGYKDNTLELHAVRAVRNGTQTTEAIRLILRAYTGEEIENHQSDDLDQQFMEFCGRRSIKPMNVERTYFALPESFQLANFDDMLVARIENDPNLAPTTRLALINARIGQGRFRRDVLREYDVCMITGLATHGLLRASHIKPWRDCYNNPEQCLSPENALLLSPNWDALFDRGYVTFDDHGHLQISKNLPQSDREALTIGNITIRLSEGQRRYMQHHRQAVFRR